MPPSIVAPQSQTTAGMLLRHALVGGKIPAHLVSSYFWTTPKVEFGRALPIYDTHGHCDSSLNTV